MHEDTIDRLIRASRPTDAEIDAEFTPGTQARILKGVMVPATVVRLQPRHRTRWMGLVAAGIVVAVGAMTVQALLPSRTTTVITQGPSGTTTTVVTQPPIGLPAAAALEPMAQAAANRPSLIPTGNTLLHIVAVDTQNGSSIIHDMYVAADGWTWRKDTEQGRPDFWMLYNAKDADDSKLPTDPVALDAALRGRTGNNSADERVFKGISELLVSQTASPALKAAAIRVLDRISTHPQAPSTAKDGLVASPRITLERVKVDGQDAIKATQTDPTSRPGVSYIMVLDATTGDLIGSGASSPGVDYLGTYPVRELVGALPAEMVSALGTQRVHKEIRK